MALSLTQPEEWEVVAYYEDDTEEVVEAGLDRRDADMTARVLNHDGHAGVTYGVRRAAAAGAGL